jgi:hypothetical protein
MVGPRQAQSFHSRQDGVGEPRTGRRFRPVTDADDRAVLGRPLAACVFGKATEPSAQAPVILRSCAASLLLLVLLAGDAVTVVVQFSAVPRAGWRVAAPSLRHLTPAQVA